MERKPCLVLCATVRPGCYAHAGVLSLLWSHCSDQALVDSTEVYAVCLKNSKLFSPVMWVILRCSVVACCYCDFPCLEGQSFPLPSLDVTPAKPLTARCVSFRFETDNNCGASNNSTPHRLWSQRLAIMKDHQRWAGLTRGQKDTQQLCSDAQATYDATFAWPNLDGIVLD